MAKVCTKCIIPDSYPMIKIEDGVCSFCKNPNNFINANKKHSGKNKLRSILTSKHNGGYHCVIPLSGGKDSSYITYYITKNLKLNPLIVTFDNGFMSDAAKKNIQNICKILKVDIVRKKASKYYTLQLKQSFKIFCQLNGQYLFMCGNCENNLRTLAIREAKKRKIPYIVWGSTDYEDPPTLKRNQKFFRERSGTIKDAFSRITKLPLVALRFIILSHSIEIVLSSLKYIYYGIRDNMEIKASILNPFRVVSFRNLKDIKTIYFYDYIKYDIYNYTKTIRNEVNWDAPSEKEDKMDCKFATLKNYYSLNNYGITENGTRLSSLIRNGIISRSEALEKEEAMKNDIKSEYRNIIHAACDAFGISRKQ